MHTRKGKADVSSSKSLGILRTSNVPDEAMIILKEDRTRH